MTKLNEKIFISKSIPRFQCSYLYGPGLWTSGQHRKVLRIMPSFIDAARDYLFECDLLNKKNVIEFNLLLCSAKEIKRLNFKHRKKNKVTDILSFPNYGCFFKERPILQDGAIFLGDCALCVPVCLKQSNLYGFSLEQEFFRLLIHGFIHLLGYDHEKSLRQEKLMIKQEKSIANRFLAISS